MNGTILMSTPNSALFEYVNRKAKDVSYWNDGILEFKFDLTPALRANIHYFGHSEWGSQYLAACHQNNAFKDRLEAVIRNWDNQIVVDIGCGPGNVYAALKQRCGIPKLLIGVDVSEGTLKMAKQVGYTPVLADAHQLPFVDGFADIVILNAALHHCDDMRQVLQEAARLVKPGGMLITDHDPQRTAWKDNALAHAIWEARLPIYRLLKRGGHATAEEQYWSTHTETHHKPGDGVTLEFFQAHLQPLGFEVNCYPHNGGGAEVLQGDYGQPGFKSRLVQWVTGIDPRRPEAALLLMCVAQKRHAEAK